MQENYKVDPKNQENEIDLGVFFNLIGKIFYKIGSAIRLLFLSLFQFLIAFLLFIKRRILWLGLAGLIGLSFGIYKYISRGPTYYSEMIVRSNFESTPLLYNQLDYFNSLIKQNRYKELSSVFNLTEKEASRLIEFVIIPIDDDIEAAKLYRNTFLDYRRFGLYGADTIWRKTMKFEEFKKQLRPSDYPLQSIKLYSSNPDIYIKVQHGLVHIIDSNKALQDIKDSATKALKDEEAILSRSLAGLDSLRVAYNRRITANNSGGKSEANNIILSDKEQRSPEIDLYDKELTFKDELISLKKRAMDQQDLLQIYSGFNSTGTQVSQFEQDTFKFTWWSILAVFVILLFVELYKYLDRIDKKRR
jgi:hypothetical protein